MLSKTSKSLSRMTKLFRDKNIQKTYWIIVEKKIINQPTHLIHFLKKNKKINKSFAKNHEEKGYLKAELSYKLIKKIQCNYLYEIQLMTGRHHQIRTQFSFIGTNIKGDIKYGAKKPNNDKSICLHARGIEFIHPIKKSKITIKAPVPNTINWKI